VPDPTQDLPDPRMEVADVRGGETWLSFSTTIGSIAAHICTYRMMYGQITLAPNSARSDYPTVG